MYKLIVIACACLCWETATAGALTPSPLELKLAFESYTKKMGIDPNTCQLGIWDSGVFLSTPKKTFANHYATCPVPATYKVCTQLAPDIKDRMPVQDGCVTGLNRLSFLPIVAISKFGGHFVVVHEIDGQPYRLAQQLTIGFGPKSNFCELSAQLLDAEGNAAPQKVYEDFRIFLLAPLECAPSDTQTH